ncbi:MAG: hypothetical protein ABS76_26620 [Pelagibacterium sp. SCN 64-44]|nr:MAG: hypothetical protein ABS76_26620 [Pelagibacterium sp. SCN 64-44]
MAAIKLHAGDFQKSAANSFNGRGFSLWSAKSTFAAEHIPMSAIESIEIASEASVKRVGGAVGWGMAGGALLGPAGLLAGLLLGGRGEETTFVAKLKDGRKFLASVDKRAWPKMLAAQMTAADIAAKPIGAPTADLGTPYPAGIVALVAFGFIGWGVWQLFTGGDHLMWAFFGFLGSMMVFAFVDKLTKQ